LSIRGWRRCSLTIEEADAKSLMMAHDLGRWWVGDGFGLCGFKDRKFKLWSEQFSRGDAGRVGKTANRKFVKK